MLYPPPRQQHRDDVAEWLRRWIANPLGFARVSSNLTVVDLFLANCSAVSKSQTVLLPATGSF